MSNAHETPPWVHAMLDKRLSATEFRVWMVLYRYQGGNGSAWPAQKTIATDLGLTVEGVRKIILQLVQAGWLKVEWPNGPGRGLEHRKQYVVVTPKTPTVVGLLDAENPNGHTVKTPTAVGRHIRRSKSRSMSGASAPIYDWTTHTFIGIQDDLLRQWSEAYPLVAVEAEIRKATAWCRNNESKTRRRSDWPRFLGNWLSRSQREAEASGGTKREPQRGDFDWEPEDGQAVATLRECGVEVVE